MNSVFFCSEEHVLSYLEETGLIDGMLLTLAQIIYLTPYSQGSLFGFT